jgi:hypothetical protein
MRCQGEGCTESAVAHITELSDDETTYLHFCQRHSLEYLRQGIRLRDQLCETDAASSGGG